MDVVILGSGTSIPHPHRASPGIALALPGGIGLIDPSAGSLHRMARAGLEFQRLSWVAISHFHPDHTGDLVSLLFAARNPHYPTPARLRLIGPPGLADHYRALAGVYGHWIRLGEDRLTIQEIDNGELSLEDCRLTVAPVDHAQPSIGMRLTTSAGRVLAYSGDSDYCSALVELARDATVAVLEASHPTKHKLSGHLTPGLAGRVAAEAGARRLVLTHLYPLCNESDLLEEVRKAGYAGPAEIAGDGLRLAV